MSVLVLELTTDPRKTGKIYRASSGDTVYLVRCPALQQLDLQLSYISPLGEPFPLVPDQGGATALHLTSAGSFRISFTDPFLASKEYTMTVLADPYVTNTPDTLQKESCRLSIDEVAVQTHLTKCCGALERWGDVFSAAVESGYNMIHLTPVQELGVSRSGYSLHSHLQISSGLGIQDSGEYATDLQVLEEELQQIHRDTGLYFMTDVVWNHVSICNTDILVHPDSYYNLWNTPNLIPAYLLDRSIAQLGGSVTELSTLQHLEDFEVKLINHLGGIQHALESLYKIDVEAVLNTKRKGCQETLELSNKTFQDVIKCAWSVDYTAKEYGGRVDVDVLECYLDKCGVIAVRDREEAMRKEVAIFNENEVPAAIQKIIDSVVSAVKGTVKYRFIEEGGLKLSLSTHPLVDRYFHVSNTALCHELALDVYCKHDAETVKTCNGWTMGESISDMSKTMAYTNREVVIWGDSVKLRYGRCEDENTWLWGYMKRYTRDMARLFHGFRIDNCHNTPIHVGEELLRVARRARPSLYVVAELFTGSEETDCAIINRMGINSCIRELSQARSPHHLGELTYHYGESKPCGSFLQDCQVSVRGSAPATRGSAPATPGSAPATRGSAPATRLLPSRPHAMFMDQTHDNPCPHDQHPIVNVLAMSGAMIAGKCSIGSNRGYDELVPHHIHVVKEERLYQGPAKGTSTSPTESCLRRTEGLQPAKRALIALHQQLEGEGYSETFVDQASRDVVIVTRHHPDTCRKILVVIATRFTDSAEWQGNATVVLPGASLDVLLEVEIVNSSNQYTRSQQYINGIQGVEVDVRHDVEQSNMVKFSHSDDGKISVNFNLTEGSIVAVKIEPTKPAQQALQYFNTLVKNPEHSQILDGLCSALDLYDMNYILYRCAGEEEADGCGGVYNIPEHGDLAYAGLVGFLHVLEELRGGNDTGHALCRNLYQGWWQAQYITNRLNIKNIRLGTYLQEVLKKVSLVPDYMRPKVFDKLLRTVYEACLKRIGQLMPGFGEKSSFEQQLILTSVQMMGKVGGAGIPASPSVEGPVGSMAAGLPHFSHGFMRSWGRDTFIALPGLLLTTGRLQDAKELIVGCARTLRYGLIPNLLGEGGVKPRYNCRDAVWFWCRAVQLLWEQDASILQATVHRFYNQDDTPVATPTTPPQCTILEILQEILTRHAAGILFTEEGAGPGLDEHLRTPGFVVTAGIDPDTGFVRGGSQHNCGTWMDKVGSSDVAGNRGIPATPRDGSAIELVALCYQTVSWMHKLHVQNSSPYQGVAMETDHVTTLSYAEWALRIRQNFESCFWSDGFYKDTFNSSGRDDELRPNQTVAMVTAPDLFSPEHLAAALNTIGTTLAGALGMCTLSPADEQYRPYYDNSNQNSDYHTAHGFNYHQGPEWVWCMGFYLRAVLNFKKKPSDDVTRCHGDVTRCHGDVTCGLTPQDREFFHKALAPHRALISSTPFRGLTELTNKGGEFCGGSCPTQAWSSGCLLELLADLKGVETGL